MKKTNMIRLTKEGVEQLDDLLSSPYVNNYHKDLLRCIKDRVASKTLTSSDCQLFEVIMNTYK